MVYLNFSGKNVCKYVLSNTQSKVVETEKRDFFACGQVVTCYRIVNAWHVTWSTKHALLVLCVLHECTFYPTAPPPSGEYWYWYMDLWQGILEKPHRYRHTGGLLWICTPKTNSVTNLSSFHPCVHLAAGLPCWDSTTELYQVLRFTGTTKSHFAL